jgi:hypothetical protein
MPGGEANPSLPQAARRLIVDAASTPNQATALLAAAATRSTARERIASFWAGNEEAVVDKSIDTASNIRWGGPDSN